MAKELSKSGISTGQDILAGHVTQSVDALTGIEAYDITISGSTTISGSLSITPTQASSGVNVLTVDGTGRVFKTGSYNAGGGGTTPTLQEVTNQGSITTVAITGSYISASNTMYGNNYYVQDIQFANYHSPSETIRLGWAGDNTLIYGTTITLASNVTASNNISASNNIFSKQHYIENKLALDYNNGIALGNVTDPIYLINNVTASSNISASGTGSFANLQLPNNGRLDFGAGFDQFIRGYDNTIIVDGDDSVFLIADNCVVFTSDVVKNNAGGDGGLLAWTGSISITGSGNTQAPKTLTIEGDISASGNLFISASEDSSIPNIALYDTSSGQVFYTASSAIGGGGADPKYQVYQTGSGGSVWTSSIVPVLGVNSVGQQYSVISGGSGSCSTISQFSVIGGGANHRIDCGNIYSTIGGGSENCIGEFSSNSTIGGGAKNTIVSGDFSSICNNTIAGGCNNEISLNINNSGILGGIGNKAQHQNTFILGSNLTSSQVDTTYTQNIIATGSISASGNLFASASDGAGINHITLYNTSSGQFFYTASSAIGTNPKYLVYQTGSGTDSIKPSHGNGNVSSGTRSTVAGGANNEAINSNTFVGGGEENCALQTKTAVLGGEKNKACQGYSVAGGGFTNTANDSFAGVWSGCLNTAGGDSSAILGGRNNEASGDCSVVVGGQLNCAQKTHDFVGGGCCNKTAGTGVSKFNSILGGELNEILDALANSTSYSTIGGGECNQLDADHAIIGGGRNNTLTSSSACGGILGGEFNKLQHDKSFIIGSNLTSSAACTTFMNNSVVEGNISSSGTGSFTHVQLPNQGTIQFDGTPGSDDQYIYGQDNYIKIEGDDEVYIYADDFIKLDTLVLKTRSNGLTFAYTGSLYMTSSIGNKALIDVEGPVTASHFVGDGSQLSNIQRPISNSVSTDITASNSNAGYYFRTGGNITCSIQANATVPCDIGSEFDFFQTSSAGNMLFLSGSGVTLNTKGGFTKLDGQFAGATLKKVGTDEWDLVGDLNS